MTEKEESRNLSYIMFGLIIGSAFSLFGSATVGAFFADEMNPYRVPVLVIGIVMPIFTFIISYILYYFFCLNQDNFEEGRCFIM